MKSLSVTKVNSSVLAWWGLPWSHALRLEEALLSIWNFSLPLSISRFSHPSPPLRMFFKSWPLVRSLRVDFNKRAELAATLECRIISEKWRKHPFFHSWFFLSFVFLLPTQIKMSNAGYLAILPVLYLLFSENNNHQVLRHNSTYRLNQES